LNGHPGFVHHSDISDFPGPLRLPKEAGNNTAGREREIANELSQNRGWWEFYYD
jgi:hypothetical protein